MSYTLLQTTAPVTESLDVIELLSRGGIVMIFLALLSLATIFLIIERLMFFGKNLKTDDARFRNYLELMLAGKSDEAADLCAKDNSSWGRIFLYGTTADKGNAAEVDKLLEDAANVEVSRLENNLGYLSIIAGVAPLLGFIGTIIGVITIFFDISIQGEITIPVISEGLYSKMVSSAAGLVVGIIAFTAHHLFQHQVDSFVNKIQQQSLALKVTLLSGKAA